MTASSLERRTSSRNVRTSARHARIAFAVVAAASCALSLSACSASSPPSSHAPPAPPRGPRLEDAFTATPDLLVALRPAKLSHDRLYGPILQRLSQLASAQAAIGESVGTTTFAALERADEVLLGLYGAGADDAIVAVRGAPSDVDPAHLVDTEGRALWVHVTDLRAIRERVEELDSATSATPGAPNAALFVLPGREWIIATAPEVARVRSALVEGLHGDGAHLATLDADALAVLRVRGDTLSHASPRLHDGPLAPLVTHLDAADALLQPGPEGSVGEVVARFSYADLPAATAAEGCARDVLAAFLHKFEATAPWLHAVTIARAESLVVVRGRIPRAWAEGFAHPDLPASEPSNTDAGAPADSTGQSLGPFDPRRQKPPKLGVPGPAPLDTPGILR